MAITYTTNFVSDDAIQSIDDLSLTSGTLTIAANDIITVEYVHADNGSAGNLTITNSGTALTWNSIAVTNVSGTSKAGAWWAKSAVSENRTVTVTSDGSTFRPRAMRSVVHTGAHQTDPVPAAKVNSGTGGTDKTVAITPTASGSALWMCLGDWAATNSYVAAANNTIDNTHNYAGEYTATFVRPTTQPRTDANAFTIGATCTDAAADSEITWVAFEVQAAAVVGNIEATPGAGALTAAGLAPTRLVNYARAPGAGALTAGGYAPTFLERGLRYAYPTADTSAGAWTPSAGGDLFAMIDEETPADDDYIVTTTASKCKIKFLPVTDPSASTGHVINYRIWSPVAGNAVVRLIQGASTLIAEWTHTGLPTTATTYSQGLTTEQTDAITDYDDLYIEFEAT